MNVVNPDIGQRRSSDGNGTMSVSVQLDGGVSTYAAELMDIGGIQSISSATVESNDGRVQDFVPTRIDANSFDMPALTLRNARWMNVTIEVVYADEAGSTKTISGYYTL